MPFNDAYGMECWTNIEFKYNDFHCLCQTEIEYKNSNFGKKSGQLLI